MAFADVVRERGPPAAPRPDQRRLSRPPGRHRPPPRGPSPCRLPRRDEVLAPRPDRTLTAWCAWARSCVISHTLASAAMTTTSSSWLPEPVAGATTLRERSYEAIKDGILRAGARAGGAPGGGGRWRPSWASARARSATLCTGWSARGWPRASRSRGCTWPRSRARTCSTPSRCARYSRPTPWIGRPRHGARADRAGPRSHRPGERAVETGDAEAVNESIDGFHRTILLGAGSPLLTHLLGSVYDRLARASAMAVARGTRGAARWPSTARSRRHRGGAAAPSRRRMPTTSVSCRR